MALLGLVLCFLILWQDQQRIFEFMSTTGQAYDQGFAFVYYGDNFKEDLAVLGLMKVLAATTSAGLILQTRHTSKGGPKLALGKLWAPKQPLPAGCACNRLASAKERVCKDPRCGHAGPEPRAGAASNVVYLVGGMGVLQTKRLSEPSMVRTHSLICAGAATLVVLRAIGSYRFNLLQLEHVKMFTHLHAQMLKKTTTQWRHSRCSSSPWRI